MTRWKYGEQLFKQRMENGNYIVKDVSGDSEYWSKDIDFIITSPTTGKTKTFEVKWDSHINKTGNLYLELVSTTSKLWNGDGWWPHCQANYLVYGDAYYKKFYIIEMDKLRERVKHLPQKIGKCGNDSIGLLVSLDDIADITEEL